MQSWPLVLGAVLVVSLGIWWVRRAPAPDARLEADARDPYRRWVQNVFLLVTGDVDYAHVGGAEARRTLAHWWDVYGPLEQRRTLADLADDGSPDHAWDLVRFILVSRLGVAAGYYDDELSWTEILPVARRLQAVYPGWRAMAHAYLRARRQQQGLALDGTEDDAAMRALLDNLSRLDDTRWAEQEFSTPLFITEEEHADG